MPYLKIQTNQPIEQSNEQDLLYAASALGSKGTR